MTSTTPDVDASRPADHPGAQARTLCEAFQLAAAHNPAAVALRQFGSDVRVSWEQLRRQVQATAEGLAGLGVVRGETVAVMARNIPEAIVVDAAVLHLGATPFAIYATSTSEQAAYMLANADCRTVVYEPRFAGVFDDLDQRACPHRIVIGAAARSDEVTLEHLQSCTSSGFDFQATWQAVEPDDIAALIYTSGTTGPPKGVQLTHASILAELDALSRALPYPVAGRVISYLPFAHIGDRIASYYPTLYAAHTMTMVPDMADAMAAVLETRPTQWSAVPRLWEKLMASLQSSGLQDPSALDEDQRAEVRAQLGLADVSWIASGAAPIAHDVLAFFTDLGLPIVETWGMSECAGVGTVNPVDGIRPGTVGKPLPGVEYRIAEDGELLLRGRILMAGYRKNPEATGDAIDPDGWLHTGDIATVDEDGYLSIVDRKKELIINAAGKNMSPANIERQLKAASPLIAQACAIGDRRPYNTALLVLDPQVVASFADEHGLAARDVPSAADDPVVLQHIAAAVADANSSLSRVEQLKKWIVLPVDWEASSDELTPTMKLRRRQIAAKYADVIDAMYAA